MKLTAVLALLLTLLVGVVGRPQTAASSVKGSLCALPAAGLEVSEAARRGQPRGIASTRHARPSPAVTLPNAARKSAGMRNGRPVSRSTHTHNASARASGVSSAA